MRVLFTTRPAYGHFRPLITLANALEAAGHEVAVASSAMFAAVVAANGFTPHPAGLDWLESDDSTLSNEARVAPTTTLAECFARRFVGTTAPPVGDVCRPQEDRLTCRRAASGGAY